MASKNLSITINISQNPSLASENTVSQSFIIKNKEKVSENKKNIKTKTVYNLFELI